MYIRKVLSIMVGFDALFPAHHSPLAPAHCRRAMHIPTVAFHHFDSVHFILCDTILSFFLCSLFTFLPTSQSACKEIVDGFSSPRDREDGL